MARKPTPENTAPAAPASGGADAFQIEVSGAPPTRAFGGASATGKPPSKYLPYLQAMSAPSGGKYHSFFVPVELSGEAGKLEGTERTKALKDMARSTQNGIASVTRRLIKQDPSRNYAMRAGYKVEGDTGTAYGVRVWRVEPKAVPEQQPASTTPPTPPPAPAPVPVPAAAAPSVPQVPVL